MKTNVVGINGRAERSHIAALDGLRGVAILLVLIRHCSPAELRPMSAGLGSIWGNFVVSMGWGVVLFFVLSGFLITGILLDSKDSPNYYLNFYGRRVLRIFPLYYGTIFAFGVACLFHALGGDGGLFLRRLPWLLTYTTNILISFRNDPSFIFNGHSLAHLWSLAVEEQFYFIWPLLVMRCAPVVLKRICLIAMVGGFVSRTVLLYGSHDLYGAMYFLPCQSDALAMGALLAILAREREQWVADCAWPLTLAGAAVWMATLVDGNAVIMAGISGFAMMSAGVLALCLYHPIAKWFSHPVLRSFGKYSYGIYVLHVIILPFLRPIQEKLNQVEFLLLFMLISYVAGWLSWHLLESHFLKLKRFFPSNARRTWTPGLQQDQKKAPIEIRQPA